MRAWSHPLGESTLHHTRGGSDPTHDDEWKHRRAFAQHIARHTHDDEWKHRRAFAQHIARQVNTTWIPSPEEPDGYTTTIQPYLQALRTVDIQTALGVSHAAASRIRTGKLIPHRRHWKTLAHLTK